MLFYSFDDFTVAESSSSSSTCLTWPGPQNMPEKTVIIINNDK